VGRARSTAPTARPVPLTQVCAIDRVRPDFFPDDRFRPILLKNSVGIVCQQSGRKIDLSESLRIDDQHSAMGWTTPLNEVE
jgi:hypothetical protein